MGVWVRGCVGAWVRGCVGAWVHAWVRAFVGRACVCVCVFGKLFVFGTGLIGTCSPNWSSSCYCLGEFF